MKYELKEGVIILGRSQDSDGKARNLFRVRVMPDQEDITETDLLPNFPNFFVKDNIAYQPKDVVWLLTNDDYHIGFILGLKQPAAGEGLNPLIQIINSFEIDSNFEQSSYDKISIIRMSDESISFNNVQTGASGHIYNNRVFIFISEKGEIRVRNPGLDIVVSEKGEIKITGSTLEENLSSENITISGISEEKVGSK
jgi:hypothetical protein